MISAESQYRQTALWRTPAVLAGTNRSVLATLQNHHKWLQQSQGWINRYPACEASLIASPHYLVCERRTRWSTLNQQSAQLATSFIKCYHLSAISFHTRTLPREAELSQSAAAPSQDPAILSVASPGTCSGPGSLELSGRQLLHFFVRMMDRMNKICTRRTGPTRFFSQPLWMKDKNRFATLSS